MGAIYSTICSMHKIEKALLWAVKIGLWIIPFLPLYISSSMLFPFITGKNFAFRIIVEFIFALWVGLAVAQPHFRPKLTPLLKVVTVFIGVIFFADVFSLNPYRALFSNYERMEGFMMLGHLYLYFLMLVSVFKTRRDWLVFFHASLAASVAVSWIGLMQRFGYRVSTQGGFRVDSTIGNPTYLAAYLTFHLWLLVMLMKSYWQKWWLVALYGAVFLFELMILYFTATRGAVIALTLVTMLLVAAVVVLWPRLFRQNPSGRKFAGGALAFIIVVPMLFWLARSTQFIQASPVLRRLTNYSLTEGTIQARFKIWGMSGQGFWDRPILGWGQENYYLVFQKYFNPGLWGEEPWFDRSHNVVFDWLIHTGVLGLTAYFGMLAMVFRALFRTIRANRERAWEGLFIGAVFFTHLIQNFFVFDNLNTYLLFFAFLAYTHFYSRMDEKEDMPPQFVRSGRLLPASIRGLSVMAALLIVLLFAGYYLHLKPIRQSKALIYALQAYEAKVPMDTLIALFERALAYQSIGTTEVHEQIANIARSVAVSDRFTSDEKKKFTEFTIQELRKEIAHSAKDVKHLLFLGAILSRSGDINTQYMRDGKRILEEAAFVSPAKQAIYLELANADLMLGDVDAAITALKTAWDLDRSYREAGINLWIIAILGKYSDLIEEVKSVIPIEDIGGQELLRMGAAYQQIGDFEGMRMVYDEYVRDDPANVQARATYALIYLQLGRYDEAIAQAREAARLDPAFAADAEIFIREVKKRR